MQVFQTRAAIDNTNLTGHFYIFLLHNTAYVCVLKENIQMQFSTKCDPVGISYLVSMNYELSNHLVIRQITHTGDDDDHPFYALVLSL